MEPANAPSSEVVQRAKQRLADGRAKLRRQHEEGSPGIQVCTLLADMLDYVILEIYETTLKELGQPPVQHRIAVVPHGGYGRRDVAPFSDVDLMLLCSPEAVDEVIPLARRFTQYIYDSGLDLGFSLRTPKQACQLAFKDASVFTSLVESRYLAGSVRLYSRYFETFKRQTRHRTHALIAQIEEARAEEKQQFGDTVYLLRPNVKRTRGGLRDLQMVRWIGFARYREAEPTNLHRMGVLLSEDHNIMRSSYDYLLRLRNELHFHAGRTQDVLEKQEQLRLAEKCRYEGDEASLPVEQFMQKYFEATGEVRYRAAHFVDGAKQRTTLSTLLGTLFSRKMESVYRMGPRHISATRKGLAKVAGDLEEILQLMDLANHFDRRISHATWQTIREAMMEQPPQLTPNAARRFMSLMSQPYRLGALLRRLHQLRALDILVPPVTHARNRMQFNEYHKYTVDEHSFRAVEYVTALAKESHVAGRAYRKLENKAILHLAVLMHDFGKGFPQDHSELGAELAGETARRLGLSSDDTATLQFLILKHLRMAHLAFRHNLSDPSVIVPFAVEVGRLDWLRMLYVLTLADLAAVGPKVLNSWKFDLVTQLYYRTREQLGSDPSDPAERFEHHLEEEVLALVKSDSDRVWWRSHLEALPWSYYESRTSRQVYDELHRIKEQDPVHQRPLAWGRFLPENNLIEYSICAADHPGIFHRLTGALTAKGHHILRAEINTLPDGGLLDQFYVQDLDFSGQPPDERMAEVRAQLVKTVEHSSDEPPKFRRLWHGSEEPTQLSEMPTRVRIDNSTSAQHTIISVFTYDQMGLLYALTKKIYDLGLLVGFAKIGTHVDQVVDVFYVTDSQGQKLLGDELIERIRSELEDTVEQLQESSSA